MTHSIQTILRFTTCIALLFSSLISVAQVPTNVILIQLDDVAFEDIGYYNSSGLVETPHIDQLASESARFLNFYVSPVCATSRASALTGRHYLKTGVYGTHAGSDFIHPDESTIGNGYKAGGFATGFIGKWHSGRTSGYMPWDRGFDQATYFSMHKYWNNETKHNGVEGIDSGWVSTAMADRAIDFIDANQHNPFFLYYCPMTLHTGKNVMSDSTLAEGDNWHAPRHLYEYYMEKFDTLSLPGNAAQIDQLARMYGAMTQLDIDLGRVLARLDSLGLDQNTTVIFVSDNGPAQGDIAEGDVVWNNLRCPSGMLGSKAAIQENGIRSFCFIRKRGAHGYPSGDHHQLVSAEDLFPTAMDISGIDFTPNFPFDGLSFKSILENGNWAHDNRNLYFQRAGAGDKRFTEIFDLGPNGQVDMSQPKLVWEAGRTAIRNGDLKVIGSNIFDITAGNHVENVSGPTALKTTLQDQLEDWWNNEILGGPHSFGRAIFHIGFNNEAVSIVNMWCAQNASEDAEISSFSMQGIEQQGDFVTARFKVVRPGFYSGSLKIDAGKPSSGATFSLFNEHDTVQGNFASAKEIHFPALAMHKGYGTITFRVDTVADVSKLIFAKLRSLELTYEGALPVTNCAAPTGLGSQIEDYGSVRFCWEAVSGINQYVICGRRVDTGENFTCFKSSKNCKKGRDFPEGAILEWYVASTCPDGTYSDTSAHQFVTIPSKKLADDSEESGEKSASSTLDGLATLTTFPNPAYENLSISWWSVSETSLIRLVDMAGREVERVQVYSSSSSEIQSTDAGMNGEVKMDYQLTVAHLPRGLYVLQVNEIGSSSTDSPKVLQQKVQLH